MNALRRILLSLMLVAAGSATGAGHTGSGFLDDYSGLEADPDRAGAMRYIKPGADLGRYSKVALAPIEIFYDPASPYKGITPDDMKLLADSFRELVVKELEPDYPVVGTPGDGVVGLRMAITNVKMKKKKRSLLNFTPIGFAVYELKGAGGGNISLDDAVIEAELFDPATGERLGALVDRQKSTAERGKASWEELQKALTFYAQRFRQRWDAERGE